MKTKRTTKTVTYDNKALLDADAQLKPNVRALCRKLDISSTIYYRTLNAKNGSARVAVMIAKELGLNPGDVVSLNLENV